jgi:ribosomal protein S18 acetylase RimI-like enzyme
MTLNKFTKKELIEALENNIRGKFSYFQKNLKNMEVIENDSLLVINSNEMTDMFNIVCCKGNVNENQVINVINHFREKNLPFAWWVGFNGEPNNLTKILEENELKKSEEELAMAIELSSFVDFEIPQKLIIKRVDDSQAMRDYIYVITDIVPNEKNAIENFYYKAEAIIFSDNEKAELYVGYIDSQPVSTCSVFFSENVAGIFDIIASPKMRGMGIGSAMTVAAMNAALNKGYTTCILTATNDAKFLYEKIGFKSFKSMCVYS